jgi:hypothetical protein
MKRHLTLKTMNVSKPPRPYEEWRADRFDRAEDAAYTFGCDLMNHCRNEALKVLDQAAMPKDQQELRALVEKAVDTALHNVVDLLEGFWPMNAGPNHKVAYALAVCVKDSSNKPVERLDISPSLVDLPIGYWKWRQGEFR